MNSAQQNLQNEWSPNTEDQKRIDFQNLLVHTWEILYIVSPIATSPHYCAREEGISLFSARFLPIKSNGARYTSCTRVRCSRAAKAFKAFKAINGLTQYKSDMFRVSRSGMNLVSNSRVNRGIQCDKSR